PGRGDAVADDDRELTDRTISIRPSAMPSPKADGDAPAHLLLVLAADAAPRQVPLRHLPLTIGRAAPSELVLEGGTVSRRHCRLEQHDDRIVLTDLSSTNGTFINGERVSMPVGL